MIQNWEYGFQSNSKWFVLLGVSSFFRGNILARKQIRKLRNEFQTTCVKWLIKLEKVEKNFLTFFFIYIQSEINLKTNLCARKATQFRANHKLAKISYRCEPKFFNVFLKEKKSKKASVIFLTIFSKEKPYCVTSWDTLLCLELSL